VILVRNWILLPLTLAAAAALAGLGFLSYAPNRIVPGVARPLHEVAGGGTVLVLAAILTGLVLLCLLPQRRIVLLTSGAGLVLVLGVVLFAAGQGATMLAASGVPAGRTSLGPAFWLSLAAIGLGLVDLVEQARLSALGRSLLIGVMMVALAAMAWSGLFDALSLAREYHARTDAFALEFRQHVLLVALSAGISGAIGLPLGVMAFRDARFGQRLFGVLGIVQTVPSIALFGLLIGPLSALAIGFPALRHIGIAGIGVAPALIALVLYSLLPLVRNTVAGLQSVPDAVVEAARGSGMRRRQIMMRVLLPLALPVILAGFRIVVIQTVGLTVVAALIGAGGLGTFVFQGLGQNAIDLVLLGVIPTIMLALAGDALFSLATAKLSEMP
jgi:osmoprotectant transport system permease protein